jgi:SAM-dependent methyltransferase
MTPETIATYATVEWLSDVGRLHYADYWNDEAEERTKPFWILGGDFLRMESYLDEIRLPQQLYACATLARNRFGANLDGVGLDLGAGNLWAAAHLLKLGAVERLYCVEYSRHRLLKLGPAVLAHYGVPPEKIVLALGDLHDIPLPAASVDFALLSASFHHSDRPESLLAELRRVLKLDGVVLMIGEHINDLTWIDRTRHMVKFAASRLLSAAAQRRLLGRSLHVARCFPRDSDLLAGDDRLGDHAYSTAQYAALFASSGFQHICLRERGWAYQAFVLTPTGHSKS